MKYEPKWWHRLPQIIRPPYKGQLVTAKSMYLIILQVVLIFELVKWLLF